MTTIRRWLGVASLMLVTASVAHSQIQYYYTWTGAAFQSDLLNQVDNWWRTAPAPEQVGVPLVNNDNVHLSFGAAPVYALSNDLSNLRFRTLTFTSDAADAYRFEGDPLDVRDGGELINNSVFTHVFADGLRVVGNGVSVFTVNTRHGDIDINGFTTPAGSISLFKNGLEALTLKGDFTALSLLTLRGGEVALDILGGGTFSSTLGVTVNSSATGNNSILRLLADSGTVELGALLLNVSGQGSPAGSLKIIGASNTTLQFSSYTGTGTGSADNTHTLNIDLSAVGSAVKIPLGATMPNIAGIYNSITVTSGGKTGFARLDVDGNVIRNTTFDPFPAVAVKGFENPAENRIFHNVNYAISGDAVLSGSAGAHAVSTLTIQGPGTMSTSNGTQYLNLQGGFAVLMEEGFVGDYIFNARVSAGASMGYIHQYNTTGIIYFNQGIGEAGSMAAAGGNNARWVKDGPGTIVVGGTSNMLANSVWIHGGRFELNGEMTSVGARANHGIFVADSATFGGSGTIGTNAAAYGTTVQAKIEVADGGTLDASNNGKDALYIAGQVILKEGSNFHMDLGSVRGDVFHIARTPNPATTVSTTILTIANANLSLELLYAPEVLQKILLLTWDSAYLRSGQFLTVNGGSFYGMDNDYFDLNFGGYDYTFRLVYDDALGEIYLNTEVVPEPATIALLAGLALAGAVIYRRRKNGVA